MKVMLSFSEERGSVVFPQSVSGLCQGSPSSSPAERAVFPVSTSGAARLNLAVQLMRGGVLLPAVSLDRAGQH